MAINLQQKQAIVAEVAEVANKSISAVTADYRGLSVTDMTKLRADARNAGVYLRVVRNTLARRAVEGTEFECMKESFTGPLILAFSQNEPSAAARLFRDFVKENDKLEVKTISLSGELLTAKDLEKVAKLPNKEEAISMLMSVMQAPVQKLAVALSETYTQVVRTVAAVRDQKQQSA